MDEIISLDGITKDYGKGRGVFDISFSVKKGEVFGYLGPNGAGKTTTIRQLMGFIRPDKGKCAMLGQECFTNADIIQKRCGYLAGELAFVEDMTGKGFLDFMMQMKGMRDVRRREELTERFELNPHGKVRKMSKGMKQKIGIICAFMDNPCVAILDEPTSGLDPLMQNRFVELILEEKKKGTTILMSSHIFEEVEKTCDRTAIIRDGKIAAIEDMKSLSGKREKRYIVTLKDTGQAERLSREDGLSVRGREQNNVEIAVKDNVSAVLRTIAAYEPLDLTIRMQSLEELFLRYYEEK